MKIKRNEKLGRYMIAKRDIKAGEIILREKHLVMGPKVISRVVCLGCHKLITSSLTKNNDFYKCSKCSWPMCGKDCETLPSHLDECHLMHEKNFKSKIQFTGNYGKMEAAYCVIAPLRVILMKEKNLKKLVKICKILKIFSFKRSFINF